MVEFNNSHKMADLSIIETRKEKIKKYGKSLMCGTMISSMLLFSGCNVKDSNVKDSDLPIATAIIITNNNALIMDLSDYDNNYSNGQSIAYIKNMNGDKLRIGHEDIIILDGEGSHQKAEEMAEFLIGETGEVICYDESNNFSRTK